MSIVPRIVGCSGSVDSLQLESVGPQGTAFIGAHLIDREKDAREAEAFWSSGSDSIDQAARMDQRKRHGRRDPTGT